MNHPIQSNKITMQGGTREEMVLLFQSERRCQSVFVVHDHFTSVHITSYTGQDKTQKCFGKKKFQEIQFSRFFFLFVYQSLKRITLNFHRDQFYDIFLYLLGFYQLNYSLKHFLNVNILNIFILQVFMQHNICQFNQIQMFCEIK